MKLNQILTLNPILTQILNPILTQMKATMMKKIFSLMLLQYQLMLMDGPDGTGTIENSQKDSPKTLMISSSDQ